MSLSSTTTAQNAHYRVERHPHGKNHVCRQLPQQQQQNLEQQEYSPHLRRFVHQHTVVQSEADSAVAPNAYDGYHCSSGHRQQHHVTLGQQGNDLQPTTGYVEGVTEILQTDCAVRPDANSLHCQHANLSEILHYAPRESTLVKTQKRHLVEYPQSRMPATSKLPEVLATDDRVTPDTQASPPPHPAAAEPSVTCDIVRQHENPLPHIRVRLQQPPQDQNILLGEDMQCSRADMEVHASDVGSSKSEAKVPDVLVVKPDHYYDEENGGRIPVFKPTWQQFQDFARFVDGIRDYGFEAGIVKVIPPREWVETLPDVRKRLPSLKVRHPITQHFFGRAGVFQQANFENRYNYSLREFRDIANKNAHVGTRPLMSNRQTKKRKAKRTKSITEPESAVSREDDDCRVNPGSAMSAAAGGRASTPPTDASKVVCAGTSGMETIKELPMDVGKVVSAGTSDVETITEKTGSSLLWLLAMAADSVERVLPQPASNDTRTITPECLAKMKHCTTRDMARVKRCKEEHPVQLPSPRELFGGWLPSLPQEFGPNFGLPAHVEAGQENSPSCRPSSQAYQMPQCSTLPPLPPPQDSIGRSVSSSLASLCYDTLGGCMRPGGDVSGKMLPVHGLLGASYGQPAVFPDAPTWIGGLLVDETREIRDSRGRAMDTMTAPTSQDVLMLTGLSGKPTFPGWLGPDFKSPPMCEANQASAPPNTSSRREQHFASWPECPPLSPAPVHWGLTEIFKQEHHSPPASVGRRTPAVAAEGPVAEQQPAVCIEPKPATAEMQSGLTSSPVKFACPQKKRPIKIRAKLRVPEDAGGALSQKMKASAGPSSTKKRVAPHEKLDEESSQDGKGFDVDLRKISDIPADPCNTFQYTVENCKQLERDYWRNLTFSPPMYGADLSGTLWKSSAPATWNLNCLDDILRRMQKKLPGVNTPYLYFGMWKATFAWHVEDMDLYSINYLHFGAPKQWYCIPSSNRARFETVAKCFFSHEAAKCSQFLRHKTSLMSPTVLAKEGVEVRRLVQHPGEFVITFPRGYHAGYNLGYNCAESVNFALESWLPLGAQAESCKCNSDNVTIDVAETFGWCAPVPASDSSAAKKARRGGKRAGKSRGSGATAAIDKAEKYGSKMKGKEQK